MAISRHSRGADAGIRLLTIDNGFVRQLTTGKAHRVVACTSDGKHIFYVENGVDGSLNELDVGSGKRRLIYANNPFQHRTIEEAPISASGELLIGPVKPTGQPLLADRAVEAVQIPDAYSRSSVEAITWARDGTLFLSMGTGRGKQELLIRRIGKPGFSAVTLPKLQGLRVSQLGWSDATSHLYMLAWGDGASIYEMNPNEPKRVRRLKAQNVSELKVMPNGSLVFIQDVGVDYSPPDRATIDQVAHRLLLVRTPSEKMVALLKVPYKSVGLSGVQISPNGLDVAVRVEAIGGRNDQTEIQVFQRVAEQ